MAYQDAWRVCHPDFKRPFSSLEDACERTLLTSIMAMAISFPMFRSEERLLIEQALLQEERRALFEARAEIETRQKAGREAHAANLRMAAMAQAEQARAEMMARAPIRASALGSMGEQQEQEVNPDEMMNGWGNNTTQKDEKEPSEDFLNDEERENGDTEVGMKDENRLSPGARSS
ncbi:hypothetical protein Ccrd_013776 [Cynara cardunculus var. scolymus]|uniref:GLTSCR protein conserved domain-containing protein n=1 Tax=Cynara cardunculus var. scolymus TaxID=59895 RepID=A0A124SGY7_CYNCS|nr:hypothetical protein Ccrd_013776 [Cynara cardunculus var. scolymus]